MKKILVTGSGGSPSANFIRSLREMKEKIFIVGIDADKYYLQRSETDISYLAPPRTHKKYLSFINYLIDKHQVQFVHVQNDNEIEVISPLREKLHAGVFLPSKKTVALCINKYQTYCKWEQAGIKVPRNYFVNTKKDLINAFNDLKGRVWLREISGAGGKGALSPKSIKQAINWIDFKDGWGKFVAADLLTPNSITWTSIWKDGKLIVAQGRKRLYWELAKISPSGITGVTGAGVTVRDKQLDHIAMKSIKSLDSNPHGIFSVDLTYDFSGVPNPTEINIGRFFTTHEFFTRAGLNLPEIYIKLFYNEIIPKLTRKVNPIKEDLVWIRGVDFLPVLTTSSKIKRDETTLNHLLKRI